MNLDHMRVMNIFFIKDTNYKRILSNRSAAINPN